MFVNNTYSQTMILYAYTLIKQFRVQSITIIATTATNSQPCKLKM